MSEKMYDYYDMCMAAGNPPAAGPWIKIDPDDPKTWPPKDKHCILKHWSDMRYHFTMGGLSFGVIRNLYFTHYAVINDPITKKEGEE
jgi:hypothetical protein